MKLHIEERRNYLNVKVLEKRLDFFMASELKSRLLDVINKNENNIIVLDIDQCTYCDTTGLGTIQALHNYCDKTFRKFFVTGISEKIGSLMRICLLDTVWNTITAHSDL